MNVNRVMADQRQRRDFSCAGNGARTLRRLGAGFAMSLAALLPTCEAAAQKLVAAYGQPNIYNAVVWIAQEKGFFKANKLSVEVIQLGNSRGPEALAAGNIQFLMTPATTPILSRLAGTDCVLVGILVNKMPYDIVVNPRRIATIAEIKGKTCALFGLGDLTGVAANEGLRAYGIDLRKETTLRHGFRADTDRLGALVNGNADFSVLHMDFRRQYEQAGMKKLIPLAEENKTDFILSGIYTTRRLAHANPEKVLGFLRAMSEATHFLLTHKDEALDIAAKYSGRRRAEIEESYRLHLPIISKVPWVTPEAVSNSLRALAIVNPKTGEADAKQFFNASFVAKLQRDGLFDALWGADNY